MFFIKNIIFLNVLYIKQKSLKQILTYPLYLRGGGGDSDAHFTQVDMNLLSLNEKSVTYFG